MSEPNTKNERVTVTCEVDLFYEDLAGRKRLEKILRTDFGRIHISGGNYELRHVERSTQLGSTCRWTDGSNGPCETQCGKSFICMEDGPTDNGFDFCIYCGRRIEVVTTEDRQ